MVQRLTLIMLGTSFLGKSIFGQAQDRYAAVPLSEFELKIADLPAIARCQSHASI